MGHMEYSEKQLAILEAAETLFAIKGFDGASVRDIAQEAGVNVAMISYYFGSKDKLVEEIFARKTVKMHLRIENLIQDKKMSALQKMYSLLEDYVDKFVNQSQFHKVMLREQILDRPSAAGTLLMDLKKRNQEAIRKLVQAGQKSGEFKKNIDVAMMMCTVVGTVSQMIVSERFYREVNNMEALSDEDFRKQVQKKLNTHLRNIFKSVLINDEQ